MKERRETGQSRSVLEPGSGGSRRGVDGPAGDGRDRADEGPAGEGSDLAEDEPAGEGNARTAGDGNARGEDTAGDGSARPVGVGNARGPEVDGNGLPPADEGDAASVGDSVVDDPADGSGGSVDGPADDEPAAEEEGPARESSGYENAAGWDVSDGGSTEWIVATDCVESEGEERAGRAAGGAVDGPAPSEEARTSED